MMRLRGRLKGQAIKRLPLMSVCAKLFPGIPKREDVDAYHDSSKDSFEHSIYFAGGSFDSLLTCLLYAYVPAEWL